MPSQGSDHLPARNRGGRASGRRADHRCGAGDRSRSHPPRRWLPFRKRRFRPGAKGCRAGLLRSVGRCHRADGRQEFGPRSCPGPRGVRGAVGAADRRSGQPCRSGPRQCLFPAGRGCKVGSLGNRGVLFSDSSLKGGHFIELGNHNNMPQVFLQSITGDLMGPDYGRRAITRDGTRMTQAQNCSPVPEFTVTVIGSSGAGHHGACGRAFDGRFPCPWPRQRTGARGGEYAVRGQAQPADPRHPCPSSRRRTVPVPVCGWASRRHQRLFRRAGGGEGIGGKGNPMPPLGFGAVAAAEPLSPAALDPTATAGRPAPRDSPTP
jgi:hypothetical protein